MTEVTNTPQNSEGLEAVKSPYSVSVTTDKLEAVLLEKGMKVFARIDHAKGAESIGETLRPTTLVIFGNPQVGTKVIQGAQLAAIDLPMKALVWQDENGGTWLGYNSPSFLQSRHDIQGCEGVFEKIGLALKAISTAAVS